MIGRYFFMDLRTLITVVASLTKAGSMQRYPEVVAEPVSASSCWLIASDKALWLANTTRWSLSGWEHRLSVLLRRVVGGGVVLLWFITAMVFASMFEGFSTCRFFLFLWGFFVVVIQYLCGIHLHEAIDFCAQNVRPCWWLDGVRRVLVARGFLQLATYRHDILFLLEQLPPRFQLEFLLLVGVVLIPLFSVPSQTSSRSP